MKSVLQNWVMDISLRMQGVLVLALRGPDGMAKEDVAKPIVRTLRGLVMNSGREGKAMAIGTIWRDDTFMNTLDIADDASWEKRMDDFYASIDQYNIHFLQHLLHAFAVIGCSYNNREVRERCWRFYERGVHKLHMKPETPNELAFRLREGKREEEDN